MHKILTESVVQAASTLSVLSTHVGFEAQIYNIAMRSGFAMARICVAKTLNPDGSQPKDGAIMEYLRLHALRERGYPVSHDLQKGYLPLIEHADKWTKSAIPSSHERP